MKINKYKEIVQRLSDFKQRQKGKTTAICYGAQAIGATVVCANKEQARLIKQKFNIETVSVNELDQLRGSNETLLLEHFTVESLLNDAGNRIIELEKEIQDLKEGKENVAVLPGGIIINFQTF